MGDVDLCQSKVGEKSNGRWGKGSASYFAEEVVELAGIVGPVEVVDGVVVTIGKHTQRFVGTSSPVVVALCMRDIHDPIVLSVHDKKRLSVSVEFGLVVKGLLCCCFERLCCDAQFCW